MVKSNISDTFEKPAAINTPPNCQSFIAPDMIHTTYTLMANNYQGNSSGVERFFPKTRSASPMSLGPRGAQKVPVFS